MSQRRPTLQTLFPIFCSNSAIPACILSLCDRFQDAPFETLYWSPAVAPEVHRPYHRTPLPHNLARAWYRIGLPETGLRAMLERKLLSQIQEGDIAYLWPACSMEIFREIHARGNTIVYERVNSHRRNSMRVLDEAYRRLGLPAGHRITVADADEESEKLELADYAFSPSPYVRNSLIGAGVPASKLLDTSYGWDPKQFHVAPDPRGDKKEPVFLFVANGTVRKGLGQLLSYWAAAGVRGRLRIVGPIERSLADAYATELARPDVEHLPYRAQLADLYRDADVFVLASFEEGSPLVTYLALAAGLPCLVSTAAAGGVVEDGVHGCVRDPYDEIGWVTAMRQLAEDSELRARLGEAAREQSARFTWDRVAERRQAQFEKLFGFDTKPSLEPARV